MNRRNFSIGSMAALAFSATTKVFATETPDPQEVGKLLDSQGSALTPNTADRWFEDLESSSPTKEIHGALDLRKFQDNAWIVLDEISWKPKSLGEPSKLVVPRGFVTDLASVPRVFWSIFPPAGDYAYAAVLHDYAYWTQDRCKRDADNIFKLVMDDLKIKKWQANLLYNAVDRWGNSAWDENKLLKSKGEARILKTLPTDPSIKWSDYRTKKDLFLPESNNQSPTELCQSKT